MKLKFVGVSSSSRNANTNILVNEVLASTKKYASEHGFEVETELVTLAGKKIMPCMNCNGCVRKESYCILKDDWLDSVRPLIDPVPNGVVFGSPLYFYSINSQMRAYMERTTCLFNGLWHKNYPVPVPDWSRTAAGAVTVGYDRNGGQEMALTNIMQFFLINGFVGVGGGNGGGYMGAAGWQMNEDGNSKDAVKRDATALRICKQLGENISRTGILLATGREFYQTY